MKELKEDENIFSYTPELFVKEGIVGYDIGITTPESFKKVGLVGDDNELIIITTLPYCVFRMPHYRYGILKSEQRSELLKKYGWTEEELNTEEQLAGFPETLDHKYFHVAFRHI